ncbi:hypothetical protein [Citrifermentans bemidjiense]|uniref:hypothetical protein n=1 Tax=Citrifermentans bemidjiense TaxID=225194 RepID=UPI0002E88802|nr:hypothetical protein [Citrifermentans bemidjiense]
MKIMIKYRLLIAMLAATGAVVVSMFLIMQWSIGRGFLAYVNTMEEDRLGRLAQVLERAYQANGSWDFVKDDNATWSKLVAASRETSDLDRTEHGERRMTPPPRRFPTSPGIPCRRASNTVSREGCCCSMRRR